MAGMLQIITYLLCVYLVVKGIGILVTAIASGRQGLIIFGSLMVIFCIIAAIVFATMQAHQAASLSSSFARP